LGSSAAVSAALSVCLDAIYADSPDAGRDARLQRWLPVYRDALDGYASGADLAACFHGGLLVYRNVDGPVARSLRWPSGLYWQPVWVGRPAQTADFVARFRAWQAGAGSASAKRLADLGVLARQAVDAAGSASALIEAARAYAQAIRSLGEAMDCAIETPPHQRLAALAARLGTMYKSCGAGGGDIGVALDRDPDRLAAFATRAASVGAVPVDLTIDAGGAGLARPEPRCSAD
jgi:phosphomevalonate kinase